MSDVTMARVALPSLGPDPDSLLDARFGRCRWILLHDAATDTWQALERDPDALDSGAGRAAAQLLARHAVAMLLAGTVGPKAAKALEEAGIAWKEGLQGSCRDLVAAWRKETA